MIKIKIKTKFKWPLSSIAGILVILSYVILTSISIFLYPLPYSPLNNWLSDLGYYKVNPGAFLYNLGCILAGCFSLIFYIGLKEIDLENTKHNRNLGRVQILGVFEAISDIFVGVFSEDYEVGHAISSICLFLFITLVLLTSGILFLKIEQINNKIGVYGVCIGIINFIFFGIVIANTIMGASGLPLLTNLAIMEWIAVGTSLIFIGLVSNEFYSLHVLLEESK